MHKHLLILLVVSPVIAAEVPKEDPKAPLKKFEGTWKVVSGERDGEKLPADKIKTLKVIIAGDKMTIKDDKADDIATIKIDPSAKPATIDFQPSDSEKIALGIYEWNGEQVKLCWGKAGGSRPKEFATKTEAETVLFVLERDK